jgi:hypothetical protein
MDNKEPKYITFAKGATDEIKARLAQATEPGVGNENFGKTDEEILEKFFADQGIEFGAVDTSKVLALLNG